MGKRQRAPRSIANYKIAGTRKPFRADDVQNLSLFAKLLLQQRSTCLHGRVLLHGRLYEACKNPHGLTCISDLEESNLRSGVLTFFSRREGTPDTIT